MSLGDNPRLPSACSSVSARIQMLGSAQYLSSQRVGLCSASMIESSTPSINQDDSNAALLRAASHEPLESVALAESDAECQEREDADALNEVIMAVDLRDKGTIGCCYYVAREEKLYLMDDVKCGGLDVIDTCTVVPANNRLTIY